MSDVTACSAETAAGLNRRLVEAEMRSTAAADALTTLIRAELDTLEAERCLDEAMDTLLVLRRELAELLLPQSG